ncbi:MAG TPA: hydantoinase/oxoprolinase family protein [Vicinamibacterales bacterium]|nr:hydantoinase/oxoprolinase family protein [Vicinamibacterales bacterium]
MTIIGWDIGGVNTKAALVSDDGVDRVVTRAFELQRAPDALVSLLRDIVNDLSEGQCATAIVHAVTMTAELSQMFRTKREGVTFVLDAMASAFPAEPACIYTTTGRFVTPREAREVPLDVAAANWTATAHVVARHHRDALLVDVGTTTTDLIPIVDGHVAAIGRTDPARLAGGELVYTGAVRTPVEAIVRAVPSPDGDALVSAEGFALSGDVHVWRGDLLPPDYEAATPDGRPSTREFAGERLARVICADREMLEHAAIDAIAAAVADAQVAQIAGAICRIRSRHARLQLAVVTGLGAFIGARAATAAGLEVVPLADELGVDGARSAPAAAVALMLRSHLASLGGGSEGPPLRSEASLGGGPEHPPLQSEASLAGGTEAPPVRGEAAPRREAPLRPEPRQPLTIVKLGGGLLADREQWLAAITAIADAAASQLLVVVPGGGPFADAVRSVDVRVGLSDETAHWMAIAAMDQHAEMIAASLPASARVIDAAAIADAIRSGLIPVLAPLQWLRSVDPLPHSWDVTSDSIAAWVAGVLGAQRLVLIKPAGASGPEVVDSYFLTAVPERVEWHAVTTMDKLGEVLAGNLPAHRPSAGAESKDSPLHRVATRRGRGRV